MNAVICRHGIAAPDMFSGSSTKHSGIEERMAHVEAKLNRRQFLCSLGALGVFRLEGSLFFRCFSHLAESAPDHDMLSTIKAIVHALKDGREEKALAIAGSMSDPEWKDWVFTRIAVGYAEAGLFDASLGYLEMITDSRRKAASLVHASWRARDKGRNEIAIKAAERAINVIECAEEGSTMGELLVRAFYSIIRCDGCEQALKVVKSIQCVSSRSKHSLLGRDMSMDIIEEIAHQHIYSCRYEEAVGLANSDLEGNRRDGILVGVAERYAKDGLHDECLKLLLTAENLSDSEYSGNLVSIVRAVSNDRRFDLASSVTRFIQVQSDLVRARVEIARSYNLSGRKGEARNTLEGAYELARKTPAECLTIESQATLTAAFMSMGMQDRALGIVEEVKDLDKDRLLREIAGEASKHGEYDLAVDTVRTMNHDYWRGSMFGQIADDLLKAHRKKEALLLMSEALSGLGSSRDRSSRSSLLHEFAHFYSRAGEKTKAERLFCLSNKMREETGGGTVTIRVVGVGEESYDSLRYVMERRNRLVPPYVPSTKLRFFHVESDPFSSRHVTVDNGCGAMRPLSALVHELTDEDAPEREYKRKPGDIRNIVEDADLLFLISDLQREIENEISTELARLAKEKDITTVALAPWPADRGRLKRTVSAPAALRHLLDQSASTIIIPTERNVSHDGEHDQARQGDSFHELSFRAIEAICATVAVPGYIGVDFGDVRIVLDGIGVGTVGTGTGSSRLRGLDAVLGALDGLLMGWETIKSASRILVCIMGPPDFKMEEFEDVSSIVEKLSRPDAHVILSVPHNGSNEVRTTILTPLQPPKSWRVAASGTNA